MGFCPMETVVNGIDDLHEALQAIHATFAKLHN